MPAQRIGPLAPSTQVKAASTADPPQYKAQVMPPGLDDITLASLLGATDKEICAHLQIGMWKLKLWNERYPFFRAAIREGRLRADRHVLRAHYKRAVGYSYYEEAPTRYGKVRILKHMPGDVKAQISWLSHRQKENWKDVKALEIANNPAMAVERARLIKEIYEDLMSEAPEKVDAPTVMPPQLEEKAE